MSRVPRKEGKATAAGRPLPEENAELYDRTSVLIERANTLTEFAADRLFSLTQDSNNDTLFEVASSELYALHIILETVSDRLRSVLDNHHELGARLLPARKDGAK
jgi:hypothetical protein